VAVPLGMLLLLESSPDDDTRWRLDGAGGALIRRASARAAIVAAGAIAALAIPLLLYDANALYEQVVGFQLRKNRVYRHEPGMNMVRASRQLTANLGLAATAAIGMVVLVRKNVLAALWLVAWLAAGLAVLAGQSPLFWRHFSVLTPVVALAAASVVALVESRPVATQAAWSTLLVMLLSCTLFMERGRSPITLFREEPEVAVAPLLATADWIRAQTEDGDLIAGDDQMAVYLAGRSAPPGLCDTSMARITARSLTLHDATSQSSAARMIVLRRNGRLSKLRGYDVWLAEHAREQSPPTQVRSDRTFWIRRP
jgi:hypothetical protein